MSTCDERRKIFDDADMTYYNTKDNDTWTMVCNGMSITHSQRKFFYKWLRGHELHIFFYHLGDPPSGTLQNHLPDPS
eukprot:COSAG01_NODE_1419_length_10368_cov_131.656344_15_plen_77_part_00